METEKLLETVDALAKQINISDIEEIEVETNEFRVKMRKRCAPPPPPIAPAMAFPSQPAAAEAEVQKEVKAGNLIKSPIIGTFYSAAAPDKPAFVSVGSKVTKGKVVCIIESMKLMNEITSEFDGTITEILVSDGEAVEFDQPIMRVE